MTETEWLACTDPTPMLAFLNGKVGESQLRWFACACCRRVWPLLTDPRSRKAVETVEQYLNGETTPIQLDRAADDALEAARAALAAVDAAGEAYYDHTGEVVEHEDLEDDSEAGYRAFEAFIAADERQVVAVAASTAASDILRAVACADLSRPPAFTWGACRIAGPPMATGMAAEARLLRDIVNPFHGGSVDPAWLAWGDGVAGKIAGAIHDGRRFGDLPLLADALEDAGCADAGLLNHCRQPGEHVRGCWALDLLRGGK